MGWEVKGFSWYWSATIANAMLRVNSEVRHQYSEMLLVWNDISPTFWQNDASYGAISQTDLNHKY
jgi:hypothetical protein